MTFGVSSVQQWREEHPELHALDLLLCSDEDVPLTKEAWRTVSRLDDWRLEQLVDAIGELWLMAVREQESRR